MGVQLRIEYHPASDSINAKTPDDSVTIDIASRKQTIYNANDPGFQRTQRESVSSIRPSRGRGASRYSLTLKRRSGGRMQRIADMRVLTGEEVGPRKLQHWMSRGVSVRKFGSVVSPNE